MISQALTMIFNSVWLSSSFNVDEYLRNETILTKYSNEVFHIVDKCYTLETEHVTSE